MKLGVFDSGLGGLVIANAIHDSSPDINMLYFGDTLHLPYGNRSFDAIYEFSKRAIDFMFSQGCTIIIVACNTVSAGALRKLQQEYLPQSKFSNRRILGVVVPTLECAIDRGYKNLALIATNYTIKSDVFKVELQKLDPEISILQKETPLLVAMIENDGGAWLPSVIEHYLGGFRNMGIEALILGCTHYPILKAEIENCLGDTVDILSQDEIIPAKLYDYLNRHPELDTQILRGGVLQFFVSDITDGYVKAAVDIYGDSIQIEKVVFCHRDNVYKREGD